MYMRINYMSNYIILILYPPMPFNKIPCIQLPHLLRQFQNKEINYINHYQKFTTTRNLQNATRLRIRLPLLIITSQKMSLHIRQNTLKLPINQSSQKQSQSTKRELRSSNTNKKISDLASNKLNLPPFEDQK